MTTEEKFSFAQLRALRNASTGVKRLSENLKDSCMKIACEIANEGRKGDEIELKGRYIYIDSRSSNLATYDYLFISEEGGYDDEYCAGGRTLDFEGGYLHGDFNCYIAGATREDYVFFAENIKAIVEKFTGLWNDTSSRMAAALANMKKIEEK